MRGTQLDTASLYGIRQTPSNECAFPWPLLVGCRAWTPVEDGPIGGRCGPTGVANAKQGGREPGAFFSQTTTSRHSAGLDSLIPARFPPTNLPTPFPVHIRPPHFPLPPNPTLLPLPLLLPKK